jgi:sigma-B regulation protein RsbU (phosphoserine phosphatase)
VSELSEILEETMRDLVDEADNSVLLTELNQLMIDSGMRGRFATAVAASYNVPEDRWAYAYAGHPCILHGLAGSWEQLQAGVGRSLPVGILHDALYLQTEMAPTSGEWLLLYSDGATDIRRASGGRLGVDGLLDLAGAAAAETPDTISAVFTRLVDALVKTNRGDDFEDDLTLVLLRRSP